MAIIPQRKRTILYPQLFSATVIVIFLFVFADRFAWAHSSSLVDENNISLPIAQADGWTTYQSEVGGYSFDYPSTYVVTELETGHVQVRPIADSLSHEIITLRYLSYEIEDEAELLTWLQLYDMHVKEGQYDVTFHLINERHAYMASTATSPIPIQAHLLVNGNLVLSLSAHDVDESRREVIEGMVKSIRFAADAPQDLRQLYAPAPPPPITMLTEFVSLLEERGLVEQALQLRTDIGETPTALLSQMSAQAKRQYALTLDANQKLIDDIDRQRGFSTLMMRVWRCFWVVNCNNTTIASLPAPISPLPTSLPSENWVTFRGDNGYNDAGFFQVTYPLGQWQAAVNESNVTILHHQQIDGCTLSLKAGAFERGETAEDGTIRLGEYQWGWGWFPEMGRIFYGISLENRPYLLEIIYDKAFAAETIASCRTAAEAVIATFQPVASLDGP